MKDKEEEKEGGGEGGGFIDCKNYRSSVEELISSFFRHRCRYFKRQNFVLLFSIENFTLILSS